MMAAVIGILEALTEAQDGAEEDVVEIKPIEITKPPPFLPTELLDVIARQLINLHDLRTCAMLNRTCRDIHYGTLPTLWNTLVCQTELGAGRYVETEAWKGLVSRTGFQHVRFFVVESLGASAFAVMTAFKVFESHERQEIMEHVRAVIVTDSTSWPHHPGPTVKADATTKIKDGRFTGIRLKDKYTYGSSDLYHLLYALGQGQHLVLHVFPSAESQSNHCAEPSTARFTFKPAQLGPVAHIGCITVNMYHEPEETEEYRTMTPQVMSEMLGLVAYSRGLFYLDTIQADDDGYYEGTTVDVIGVDGEMAVLCMDAFAAALKVAPGLATISLQLQMDLLAPPTDLTRRLVAPLAGVYSAAMCAVGRERAGNVKVSLVSGHEHLLVVMQPGAKGGEEGADDLQVVVTDYGGRIVEEGELDGWLNGEVTQVGEEMDVGSHYSTPDDESSG